jgi:hypothetical protein
MIDELMELLQERDPDRRLDSLETVVVVTYLREHLSRAVEVGPDSPHTIRGWVTWADRLSWNS